MLVERNKDLDFVGGILICHMILGHICQWADMDYKGDCVLYFFMPWFFYKSGMFFKKNSDWREQLRKDAHHLLIPFLVFSAIGQIFLWINLFAKGDMNWLHYVSFPKWLLLNGSIPANSPLWFLLSLFIVKIIYNVVSNRISNIYIIVIALGVAFIDNYSGIYAPYYLANSALGLVFFILGSRMKILQYNKYVVLIAAFSYAISIVFPSSIGMLNNVLVKGHCYLLATVYALAGIIVINKVAQITPPRFYNTLTIRGLCNIGRNSMNYYIMHWIILMIVKTIVIDTLHLEGNSSIYFFSLLVACAVVLPILSHTLNKLNNTKFRILLGKKW